MANWKAKVRFTDLWDDYTDGKMPIEAVVQETMKRLREGVPVSMRDEDFDELLDDLELIDEIDDFDDWTDRLYDWGNRRHRLFVETIA